MSRVVPFRGKRPAQSNLRIPREPISGDAVAAMLGSKANIEIATAALGDDLARLAAMLPPGLRLVIEEIGNG